MAPETSEEQLARELMRLGATSRLKNAPRYHFWEIGEAKRALYRGLDAAMVAFYRREVRGEQFSPKEKEAYESLKNIFFDEEVNPYTLDKINDDEQTAATRRLMVLYHYEKEFFVLDKSEETAQQILDHFHPIRWPEFNDHSTWELFREVIPAMQVARAQLKVYEEQRWLYDERSQRAAETLAHRIQNKYSGKLSAQLDTSEQQRRIFEEYKDRLERGTNPRRWFQETLAKLTRNPRKSST